MLRYKAKVKGIRKNFGENYSVNKRKEEKKTDADLLSTSVQSILLFMKLSIGGGRKLCRIVLSV